MPKRVVQFEKGHYYHIHNRGAGRHNIFLTHANYIYVLRKIKEICARFQFTVISYVLMPNHYHLLVRQDGDVALRELPKRVFGGFSRAVSKERSGTLFEGRFKADLITEDNHLKHLCRYIHCNPVKDGFVSDITDWQYSNYLEWVEERDGTLVDRQFIVDWFESVEGYKAFVHDYVLSRVKIDDDVRAYWEQVKDG